MLNNALWGRCIKAQRGHSLWQLDVCLTHASPKTFDISFKTPKTQPHDICTLNSKQTCAHLHQNMFKMIPKSSKIQHARPAAGWTKAAKLQPKKSMSAWWNSKNPSCSLQKSTLSFLVSGRRSAIKSFACDLKNTTAGEQKNRWIRRLLQASQSCFCFKTHQPDAMFFTSKNHTPLSLQEGQHKDTKYSK